MEGINDYKKVIKEFKMLGIKHKKLKLKVFSEGMATYEVKDNGGVLHELNIINENISFFRNQKIKHLLDEPPFYLSHRYEDNSEMKLIFEYRVNDYINQNKDLN